MNQSEARRAYVVSKATVKVIQERESAKAKDLKASVKPAKQDATVKVKKDE